jgi:hypothetical protein
MTTDYDRDMQEITFNNNTLKKCNYKFTSKKVEIFSNLGSKVHQIGEIQETIKDRMYTAEKCEQIMRDIL